MAKKSTVKSKKSKTLPKVEKAIVESSAAKKMSSVNRVLIGFVAVLVLFLLMFSVQSNDYAVEREITIPAPVDKIFAQVNDLHNWSAWSPWEKPDLKVKLTFDGPVLGMGSVCHFTSQIIEDEANMVITESVKNEHVSMLVDFFGPIYGRTNFLFTFEPKGSDTVVKWRVVGLNSFGDKIANMFGAGNNILKNDIQYGLDQLKTLIQPGDKNSKS